MQERLRMVNNWPTELTKGRGESIALKLQSLSTADEVINWSIKQYRNLGLVGLALAFSYVANNPGQINKGNKTTYKFVTAISSNRIKEEIKGEIIVNLDINNPMTKQKLIITRNKYNNKKQKLLESDIFKVEKLKDIEKNKNELKQIMIELDPSLGGINNSSKSDEKESKLMILQYLEAFEKSKLNDYYNLGNNLSPKKIYSELNRMFSKIIKENYISTSWSDMADQSGESIIHKLIYVLQNSNDLKQQHISYTQLFILLTNYLYIDGLRELELVNRLKKERGK